MYIGMIGSLIGVVKGRRNKLPNTSDQETENYVTNDHETTEAIVTIEDELDTDLYPDPGANDQGWDFVYFLFFIFTRIFSQLRATDSKKCLN